MLRFAPGDSELPELCEAFQQRVAEIFNHVQLSTLSSLLKLRTGGIGQICMVPPPPKTYVHLTFAGICNMLCLFLVAFWSLVFFGYHIYMQSVTQ